MSFQKKKRKHKINVKFLFECVFFYEPFIHDDVVTWKVRISMGFKVTVVSFNDSSTNTSNRKNLLN